MPLTATRSLVCVLFLAACYPQAKPMDPVTADPVTSAAESCTRQGGTLEKAGLLGNEICFRPTPDAGQPCKKAGDCTSVCLADTGTCSAVTPTMGCLALLDDLGKRQMLCIE